MVLNALSPLDPKAGSNHVALLFPPGTDPRGPHLSLPALAATLRAAGIRTTVRDLDIEGLLALIDPHNVAEATKTCAAMFDRTSNPAKRSQLRELLSDAELVVTEIAKAPKVLRDAAAFYQPHLYYNARECIVRALNIVSAAADSVHYNIGPVQYEVDGIDLSRLQHLAAVTADPRTNLFDCFYEESLLPKLEADPPDLIGISILNYQQVIPGLTIARTLKEKGYFVVIGGTVYTKFVDNILRLPDFFHLFCDGLVPYEGETAMLALLDQLAGSRDFSAVPNFVYLNTLGEPVINAHHIEDVNSLPTPDFDGMPLDQYLAPAPVLPILTGKGCYFNRCKFCDIPFINRISKKAYRVRTPERIAADVAELQRRYNVRHFEITDEALAPKLLMQLADALDDQPGVEARFLGFARLEPGFTREVCERIYEKGFRKLFFGLESGSQFTLDHMDKGIKIEDARVVLSNCLDAGIAFHVFSIIGFPEETEERARETLKFFIENASLIGHPRNSFDIHRFTLDLRTEYSHDPARFGIQIDAQDLANHDFPISIERWKNTRGLEDSAVERLLIEFHAELRRVFRAYHPYPMHVFPDWGTYALLYADHYEGQPFPFRLSLPPSGDPLRFRLIWTESVRVEPVDGDYLVRCITGEGVLKESALLLLAKPFAPLQVDELLETLAAQLTTTLSNDQLIDDLRGLIDSLLLIGALRVEPALDDMPIQTTKAVESIAVC